jgi:2-dehydropantoate 2-reductase
MTRTVIVLSKKIAIIGAGAIGRLLAWTLRQGGHRPVLICRRAEQAEVLAEQGILLYDADGTGHQVEIEAVWAYTRDDLSAVDGAILTVKSYDTSDAGKLIRDRFPDVPVLSLQNGLGNGEKLAKSLPASQITLGLTTHGATAEGETSVHYKGRGETVIGDFQPGAMGAKWWAELLAGCGHPVKVADDIRREVWSKAMVNIGINPLTALFGLTNGELLGHRDLLAVSQVLVAEAEAVARAEGVELHGSFRRVLDVCRATAANRSSMLQDMLRRRPTEIEALCGEIVRLGRIHGLATPGNQRVFDMVTEAQRNGAYGRIYHDFLISRLSEFMG